MPATLGHMIMHHLFALKDLFCKDHTSEKALVQMLFLPSQPVHCSKPSLPAFLFMCGSACNDVHLVSVIKVWRCVLTALHLQVGAHIHTVTKEEYTKVGSEALLQQLADQLRSQGKKPYCIPVGGSSPLGCWGYLEAVREIQEQTGNLGITDIALVSVSSPKGPCLPYCVLYRMKTEACLIGLQNLLQDLSHFSLTQWLSNSMLLAACAAMHVHVY